MADTPNFNDEYKNDALFQKAALGIDVEDFIYNDKIGIYLVAKAEESRQAAVEAWTIADPTDIELIRKLQWQYRVPDLFLMWLSQAMSEGKIAEHNIVQEEKGFQ
jgi:hypothetical protein